MAVKQILTPSEPLIAVFKNKDELFQTPVLCMSLKDNGQICLHVVLDGSVVVASEVDDYLGVYWASRPDDIKEMEKEFYSKQLGIDEED